MAEIVSAFNLGCAYPQQATPATNVSFTLHAGELLCLAGVNGSGKSALLFTLAGLFPHLTGDLTLLGATITPKHGAPDPIRKQISLMVQDASMQILGATVAEDLLLSLEVRTRAGDAQSNLAEAQKVATEFGLLDYWDTPAQHLSYGQKRKLCLAGAMLRSPRLLLLDEPLDGLDYPAVKELRQALYMLKQQGLSIIVSSHDLDPFLEYADSFLFLSPQHTCCFGPAEIALPQAVTFGIRPPMVRQFP